MANPLAETKVAQSNPIPSSSPAFGTPAHPILPRRTNPIAPPQFKPPTILPVLLPPATLRPLAFRTFTKKHNLTLTSSALAALATFIGRHCGSGWREEGLAEGVLEEAAKMWKKESTSVIVDGDNEILKNILKTLEPSMVGGKVQVGKPGLSRQGSFAFSDASGVSGDGELGRPVLETQNSFGISGLEVQDEEEDNSKIKDPREWIKVISTFEQPRLTYNAQKKNFDKNPEKPSLLAPPTHKIEYFRQRYHIVHQRILRNESFQSGPSFAGKTEANRITPIANLLGRSGSTHLLLGLLTVSATGTLAVSDLTGTIALDIQHARPVGEEDSSWFCPGMIVLIDGVYSEDYSTTAETALGNSGGIGGTIGGKFIASVMAHPPCERRAAALGIQENSGLNKVTVGGPGFGWTDFLGVGSERATGIRMRKLESQILGPGAPHAGNAKIAIASELNLDNPASLAAVRTLLSTYSALDPSEFPMSLVLIGNFVSHAALAGSPGSGSIEYKEYFNALASVFSDYPQLIARLNIVFVPGDKDAWHSAFSAGAASPLPQKPVPELFTSRLRRVMAEANREVGGSGKGRKEGEIVWTSNPTRLTWFGTAGEMAILRDDATGRLRRNALRFNKETIDDEADEDMMSCANGTNREPESQVTQTMEVDPPPTVSKIDPDTLTARRLTKTILDQGHLAPYSLHTRPVHWDYGSALQLYPLPTALVLADPEAPAFALNYMGCCVINPGCIVDGRRGEKARWVEYDVVLNKGTVRSEGG
ncbi:uncharacterized protein PV09_03545 [Verruconis gallopava]|uniref:DNA polymerase epsilon subunit B n=1 Tax=Verruconis gallopava TaxID=253628 RepID=A0A0D1YYA4_9PEZI|nr:uncharacterized protein PV09_03545 [Verruconis gallopava]KIW05682.1 hypothetical protein PV09_03545 [Verruconis gallopava]